MTKKTGRTPKTKANHRIEARCKTAPERQLRWQRICKARGETDQKAERAKRSHRPKTREKRMSNTKVRTRAKTGTLYRQEGQGEPEDRAKASHHRTKTCEQLQRLLAKKR